MEDIFAVGPFLLAPQNVQQRFRAIEPKLFAGLFLNHIDALAVEVGPFHFDHIAAALPGVVQAHANKLQVPRASGIERLDHFIRPNQMTLAIVLVVALDAKVGLCRPLRLNSAEALGANSHRLEIIAIWSSAALSPCSRAICAVKISTAS